MYLVFDTETTGLVDFRNPAVPAMQPHIVQLALLLGNEFCTIFKLSMLIRPNGWVIPEKASKVHGITTEMAERFGLKIETAMGFFSAMCKRAELVVAHNYDFDAIMIAAETARLGLDNPLAGMPSYCTMKRSTEICKIPNPKYPGKFKWPKLEEAYEFFLNETMEGAHDAMCDVEGTFDVFLAMKAAFPNA